MGPEDKNDLLTRYAKRETSTQEDEEIERWLDQYSSGDTTWQELDEEERTQWLSNIYNKIKAGIAAGAKNVVPLQRRKVLWYATASIAAAITIFVVLLTLWSPLNKRLSPEQINSVTVPLNQQKQITLSDGSRIRLNSGAELKYPDTFHGATREVYLSGEAYFDIEHNRLKPFIIHTGNVITTVLGTAFNINAVKGSSKIVVTVTRGKVSVSDDNGVLALVTPNQQLAYNTENHKSVRQTVNASKFIAWQNGDLHFEDLTFREAALILQQRFKVRILFTNDKVQNCRFSGTALEGKNIDQVLTVICAFNDATYTRKSNGSIIIDGQGCN